MRIHPISVPLTDELTKRANRGWAPTPSMRERNPEWLVDRDIDPHIPVLDKAGRTDGTWNRVAFE